jgi:hypothetical protein
MDEAQLQQIRESLETILPDMDVEGLSLDDVRYDFYTQSIDTVFGWNGKRVRVRLTLEKIKELTAGGKFAAKRLRETLCKTFGIEEN